jgi:hypothetical protein
MLHETCRTSLAFTFSLMHIRRNITRYPGWVLFNPLRKTGSVILRMPCRNRRPDTECLKPQTEELGRNEIGGGNQQR